MKKSNEIRAKIAVMKAQIKELMNKEGVTVQELTDAQNNIALENQKLDIAVQLEADEELEIQAKINNGTGVVVSNDMLIQNETQINARYEEAFYNGLRNRATIEDREIITARNSLSSLVEEDGGALIPIDQEVAIRELRREFVELREHVTVEPVGTRSGSRILEKNADMVPFVEFVEGAKLTELETPKFTTLKYEIKDRGGILPIPSNLLNDNKANLKNYLNKWIAKKSVATENHLILTLIGTLTKVPLKGIDDIKNIIDVQLDPAISIRSKLITNQDGFNYLNKLKDSQGNYLLEKDPKFPTKKLISGREIVVISNQILKTVTKKAPIIIGSLTDAIVLFDRQATSLLSTNIGGTAFENNTVNIRAIMRNDIKLLDSAAVVYGQLDLTPVVG
ncbi:MAG: phage major capsid protein [Fusobacteriaceae bacterium]